MKHTTQKGYAILFAVVIVSVISVIAFGLSNSTYKQLILSSVASDSQLAFFQSDMATECALYADKVLNIGSPTNTDTTWICGHYFKGGKFSHFDITRSEDHMRYSLVPTNTTVTDPCFEFDVTKSAVVAPVDTVIKARGYNSCDKSSLRTVEREIKIAY